MAVIDVFVQLVTAGDLVDFDGASPVRRVHHAAWVGIGDAASGIYNAFVQWGEFLDYETRDWAGPLSWDGSAHVQCVAKGNTFYWDVKPGTTVYIEVTF